MAVFSNDKYQEVVIHDLRTPHNVISLALRMLDATAGRSSEFDDDIALIRANASEQERMLTYLVDFSRLPASTSALALDRFDPRRMLTDLVDEYRARPGTSPVDLDTSAGPELVTLDPSRARMAVQASLSNAQAAAGGGPISLRLIGRDSGRCEVRLTVAVPPRESVFTHTIDPLFFERLLGTPAERRGLDLTIAARISSLFGGVARLEAMPGQGTTIVLDWPAHAARPT